MPFRFLEHTADVRVECTAETFDGLLETAAQALYAITLATRRAGVDRDRTVTVTGAGYDEVFLRWLQELIFLLEADHFVATQFCFNSLPDNGVTARLSGYECDAADRGEEVKSATYHELEVRKTDEGFLARVIFDL
jgi:SHS2 domain-containing protein